MKPEEKKNSAALRMHNITVKQVRFFLVAVECKNLSRAAQQVFQAQSAFSRCIQDLEEELGEKVFKRSHSGVSLTEAGQAFLPYAHKLLAAHSDAVLGLDNWRANRSGKLILAGSNAVMPMVLPTLLERLRIEFDQPSIELQDGSSAQVIASVLASRSSLGICAVTSQQPELQCIPLLDVPLGLIVGEHCTLPASIQTLDDLNGVPMLRFCDDAVITQTLRAHGIAFDAYFKSTVVSSGVPISFPLVRGKNMAMVASGIGATHPQADGLKFVPLPGLLPSAQVSLIYRKDAGFDPHQHILREVVRDSVLATDWHPTVTRILHNAKGGQNHPLSH
jgi:DNA-binding transcriptional LysR family regulator